MKDFFTHRFWILVCFLGINCDVKAQYSEEAYKLIVPGYSESIQPLFQEKCSSCHRPAGPIPNLLDYPTARAKAGRILSRAVESDDMPPGAPLTREEKELIARWVRGGAPETAIESAEGTFLDQDWYSGDIFSEDEWSLAPSK